MDFLVMLEEHPARSPVLAHVNAVPSPFSPDRASRDVVTLYGEASVESLALALAAAVESRRAECEGMSSMRHLGIWPERGAVGDAAWRDATTGQLMTRDVAIPLQTLAATAGQLLDESGPLIRRLIAGLRMPDWPEGARRALSFSMPPMTEAVAATNRIGRRDDALLDLLREADGLAYDFQGD
jgi:hypothetical protein